MRKIWRVTVTRKINKSLVYGNEGGEEVKEKFEKDISKYDPNEYDIEWEERTNFYIEKEKREEQIKKTREYLKKLKNSELNNFSILQIKGVLKKILDILVEREEISEEN